MTKKKVVSLMLVLAMIITLPACSSGGKTSEKKGSGNVDSNAMKTLTDCMKKMDKLGGYLISTSLQAPDGNGSYIEVFTKDGSSYTEYPVDEDGNIISDVTSIDDSTGYALQDWMTKDGDLYSVNNTANEESKDSSKDSKESKSSSRYYKMPSSYAKLCSSRKCMYLDMVVPNLSSLEKDKDPVKLEDDASSSSEDTEEYTVYKGVLPSKYVRELLGINTEGLYTSIKNDYSDDSNLVNYAKINLDELDASLTFSDAEVEFYVSDGYIQQMTMEIGGLGTKLYYTKELILDGDYTEREEPDFTDADEYVDSLSYIADYLKDYDNYDDAMNALYNDSSSNEDASGGTSESDATTKESKSKSNKSK